MATTMSLVGRDLPVGNAFACRSAKSVFRLDIHKSPFVLGDHGRLLIAVALIYVPPLRAVFHLLPLQPHLVTGSYISVVHPAVRRTRKYCARWFSGF
jgi:hypothetical protein